MSASSPYSASAAAPAAGETPPGTQAPLTPDDFRKVPLWRSGVILLMAAVVGLAYWFNPPLDVQAQAGVVMDLPGVVGDYFGKQGEISKVELDILPKDTEFARRYYDDSRGHQINCSIVLSGAEQRSIHRPEACLTGQGWTIVGQENIPIPLLSGHQLVARKLTLERQVVGQNDEHFTVRAFYIYWFVGQNVTTPSEVERVLLSNWDRVIHNHAHRWAYVSVFSLITENLRPDGLNAEQTQALLVDFTKQIVPAFQISEMPKKT
jgi:EpsI family protein